MKGDFSRYTFDKKKHYNGVLMQQGRVQLDADWNEQQAIDRYRTEARGTDVIGPCGAPSDNPGFKSTFKNNKELNIGKGRYYTDGIMSENEQYLVYNEQPDFPGPPDILELMKDTALGLVYLDVWQRHITALDDPYIREKALGGPDTTTRLKTVWQVKVLPLPSVVINKPDVLAGKIVQRQNLEKELNSLLLQPEVNTEKIKKAYLKLADVRHEIIGLVPHHLCGKEFEEWKKETVPGTGTLNARTVQPPTDERPCLLPPLAGYQRLENQLYRVEVHKGGTRSKATFKWSRDNASVVTVIKKINGKEITVSDVGKDEVLGFANNQWVEISDDKTELSGQPGQLVRIVNVNSATNVIETEDQPISVDMELHPKLRRWDQVDQTGLPATKDGIEMKAGWLPLEEGIEVKFSNTNDKYKTGDYWLIPGRTATGEIEWPPYEVPNTNPIPQLPLGIKHHFCRLAIFFVNKQKLYLVEDCRRLFPPVTELTSLFYVSGEGQEAMPGEELPQPLLVGVANGQKPVPGATVRFKIIEGNGHLQEIGSDGRVLTGPDGIACCRWKLDNTTQSQQVEAALLGAGGKSLHIPIIFTANLSTADQVAYDPKNCPVLTGKNTVQKAIDELCTATVGGGCAVTVGIGGQYDTLSEAFTKLKKQRDICICLLPGKSIVEKQDLIVKEKNSIKITGCGSSIEFKADTFSLSADKIMLRDFGLRTSNRTGMVILAAKEVAVDHCEFIRIADAEGPPFVLIESTEDGSSKTVLYWKDNSVSARWSKRKNMKANDYFKAIGPMPAINKALESMVKLSGIDPVKNEEVFNTTLLNTVGEIQKVSSSARKRWSRKSPRLTINKLGKKRAAPILNFFKTIEKSTVKPAELRENIVGAVAVFYSFGYSEALALSRGIGGWIEDSTINGYLTLHYYPKFTSLSWRKATETDIANRRRFLKSDRQYVSVDPVALTLRGNNLYAVISNGYSIMQVMESILTTGDWDHEMPETGYEFLRVTGNIFNSNGSGFVCQSMIMTENTFANKAGQNQDIAAFVLGYFGIFTGNFGAGPGLTIETIIRQDFIRDSANIISIIQ